MTTAIDSAGSEIARLDPSHSVAILIGVADYPRSDYPRVGAAHESVRRLATELGSEHVWGVAGPMRLVQLLDPDRATVLRTVADGCRLVVGQQGMLLVYFVGHAEPVGPDLCLATHDTERANLLATAVSVADLVRAAKGSRTDRRMLILDCCYSGRAATHLPSVPVNVGEGAGWYFLGAADSSSEASAPLDGETTLFTAALLKVAQGSMNWGERLAPADVSREINTILPPDHRPVHNDVAWAQRVPWLTNRQYVRPPRVPIVFPRAANQDSSSTIADAVPKAPAFYAEPHYIGSHKFLGRQAQLDTLDDWAAPAQPHPVLLFEAIGGTGKSMLTWEWVTQHAASIRTDWAGRFWYSFYEEGALMGDFCRRALAYMTGRQLSEFAELRQATLAERLLHQLHLRPWLIVLDGLERLLVAFNRHDASQVPDEVAGETDEIGRRDPSIAIRPLDDELLRQLASAAPSKILITSRLTPRIMLNSANQAIPGVLVERLPGFRPQDAEKLMRACGVRGDSARMQSFLQRHCDCHPLVTGVLAGLIQEYLPARGSFDRWSSDPAHGGRLDVGDLDLVQKRNHILDTAIRALPDSSRQLISTIGLLPGAADYSVLDALNPHMPTPPEEIREPLDPVDNWFWERMDDAERTALRAEYEEAQNRRRTYELQVAKWDSSTEVKLAPTLLRETVTDLERRGLLQYESHVGRWDLHPVVRATVNARLGDGNRTRLGQRILDYFSQHAPEAVYEDVRYLGELNNEMIVIQVLLRLGRINDAWLNLQGELAGALTLNLEAYPELCALVEPMFTDGWSAPRTEINNAAHLAQTTAIALRGLGLYEEAARLFGIAVAEYMRSEDWLNLAINLGNYSVVLYEAGRIASGIHFNDLALQLASAHEMSDQIFTANVFRMGFLGGIGRISEAQEVWNAIEHAERPADRIVYRLGSAELVYLRFVKYPLGTLTEQDLDETEALTLAGRDRRSQRLVQKLRAKWRLRNGNSAAAAEPLQEAIRMANESGFPDAEAEVYLALAQLQTRAGSEAEVLDVAERCSVRGRPPHLALARLHEELGDRRRAIAHCRAAYIEFWADGEPYALRCDLDEAATLLRGLGETPLVLDQYNPSTRVPPEWEYDLVNIIASAGNVNRRSR